MKRSILLLLSCAGLLLAACEREERAFRPNNVANEIDVKIALVPLSPGPGGPVEYTTGKGKEYEGNAYHLSQGKKLYTWFNCVGCHAHGGGGMGPPLMDDKWIYGRSTESIHASIRDGRPNGMPSFRDRVPDDQIWELAGYVRSLGGNAPAAAAPGRNDNMMMRPSENRMPNAASQGKSP
jgi:cytochrome c oxidase cbb3-type subunit III